MEAKLTESSVRKEHSADGQIGEQNIQSDTAVELAGEVSEKDQTKEVYLELLFKKHEFEINTAEYWVKGHINRYPPFGLGGRPPNKPLLKAPI